MKRLEISLILTVALAGHACGTSQRANPAQSAAQDVNTPTGSEGVVPRPGSADPSPTNLAPGASPPAVAPYVTAAPTIASQPGLTPPNAPRPTTGPVPATTVSPSAPPAAPAPPTALRVFTEVTAPAGTPLPLEVLTALSSATSVVESPVRARLTRDVEIGGTVALPRGTVFSGVVTEVARAGRVKGRSRVAFRFTQAEIRGTQERIRTNLIVLTGEESTKDDATKIGGGAVVGAAIGGILGGGKGAAQGAAIGGGAGTGVVLATRGEEVSVAVGAPVSAALADPITLQVPR